MWHSGKFEDFKKTYKNVLRLLEDEDGRVRVTAFNALEQFRGFFITFTFGGNNHFEEKLIVKLWMGSLFLLWEKTKSAEGRLQYHLMKCTDALFRPDMEGYITNKEYRQYTDIWEQLQELNELYNEFGADDKMFKEKQEKCFKKWKKK